MLLTADGFVLPAAKLIAAGGGLTSGVDHVPEGGHTVIVTRSNAVYSWGDNFNGQLGKCLNHTITDVSDFSIGVKQVYYNASSPSYQNNTLMFTPNKVKMTFSRISIISIN